MLYLDRQQPTAAYSNRSIRPALLSLFFLSVAAARECHRMHKEPVGSRLLNRAPQVPCRLPRSPSPTSALDLLLKLLRFYTTASAYER